MARQAFAGDETLAQLALDSKLTCHSDERSSGYDALVALCMARFVNGFRRECIIELSDYG